MTLPLTNKIKMKKIPLVTVKGNKVELSLSTLTTTGTSHGEWLIPPTGPIRSFSTQYSVVNCRLQGSSTNDVSLLP